MAANGPRSESRQRRISSRSVRMVSNLAVTRGSVAARPGRLTAIDGPGQGTFVQATRAPRGRPRRARLGRRCAV
jgi:hypothetical protein